jgi:hypothetical protein
MDSYTKELIRFLGIGGLVMLVLLGALFYACNRATASWCADQYRVAKTHADTVTAARLCGAP